MRMGAFLTMWLIAAVASANETLELDAFRQATQPCDPARRFCFAIHVHVARAPAPDSHVQLVATPAWLAAQVTAANVHFARLDVGFQLASVDALPATAAHVRTPADRSSLAAHLRGKV